MEAVNLDHSVRNLVYPADAFGRADDSSDPAFYARDRFVSHMDTVALDTVKRIIGTLVVEPRPVILDLMAGWDSHLPEDLDARRVVGLGLNRNELSRNSALTDWTLHDLNANPSLPFDDDTFDVVLNVVSVDYMTHPFEVFAEVGRILRPGGLFLVIFSNRMFPQKAVKVWRQSGEEERVMLVEDFFRGAGVFEPRRFFLSKGKPRPAGDKYAHLGIASDPVYAVYAEKAGGRGGQRPEIDVDEAWKVDCEAVEERKRHVKETLRCPYCDERMKRWRVPDNPWSDWDMEYLYGCFNDACAYYVNGWTEMNRQGNGGTSYRLMYNPERDAFIPLPVPNGAALKDGVIDD